MNTNMSAVDVLAVMDGQIDAVTYDVNVELDDPATLEGLTEARAAVAELMEAAKLLLSIAKVDDVSDEELRLYVKANSMTAKAVLAGRAALARCKGE